MGSAQYSQRTPVRTLVGVQCERAVVPALPRAKGDFELPGTGRGRVEVGGASTLIDGTEGVTDIEGGVGVDLDPLLGDGDSLTAMVGMLGVTDIEGGPAFLEPREDPGDSLTDIVGIGVTDTEGSFRFFKLKLPLGALTEIEGVSWTLIVGMGGMEDGLERAAGACETFIVGTTGAVF